ncbi:hypothetical protein UP09_28305 [Bradyrhizobium sp. LTSP885]|uniref:hypothetical protein n=1 Tax=Bradyrhizobium sp. LTSP885 TaxID=1619232 RepID=UPI0005C7F568|nr:hypothetical protein [Bradyrhizobium sp. LTSP885]KJC37149.1 hypothetical protein UP09_28305 [Bradyrhizobium sp. LTSP885]
MQKLEAELSALTSRAALLEGKRVAAQSALTAALEARQTLLLTGDLDDSKAAQAAQMRVESAGSALAGFDVAITSLAGSVAETEGKLEIERHSAARKVASERLAAQTDAIEQQLAPWLALTRDFAASTAEVGHANFECGQIAAYLRNVASEVEMAATVQSGNLRASVAGILAGHVAIPRAPEVAESVEAELTPPLTSLFTLHAIRWIDHHGMQRQCGKWCDVELPTETAARALRLKLCALMNDPLRKTHRGQGGGYAPQAGWLNDIDNEVGPNIAEKSTRQATDPVVHSAFQPAKVGKPYTVQIAREG